MSTRYYVHCRTCETDSDGSITNDPGRVQDFIDARWDLVALYVRVEPSFSPYGEQECADFVRKHVNHDLIVSDEYGGFHRPVIRRYFEAKRSATEGWVDPRVARPGEHHGWCTYVSTELISAIYSEQGHEAQPNIPGSVPFPAASYRFHPYGEYGRPTFQHLDRATFEQRYRLATTADLEGK